MEDFIKAAEELDIEVTPLTMEDVFDIYGVEPPENEDGDNSIE